MNNVLNVEHIVKKCMAIKVNTKQKIIETVTKIYI